jgi:hypothetical protein
MASLVFTHIESVNKRDGAAMWRVITGAGIYDVAPNSPVSRNLETPQFTGSIVLAISASRHSSRIVGIATRHGSTSIGRINCTPLQHP